MRQLGVSALGFACLCAAAYGSGSESASSNISVTLTNNVTLTDVDDVIFQSGSGAYSGGDQVCLAATLGVYSITFLGSGAGGNFELLNSVTGDSVPFVLDWFNLQDGSGPYRAEPGIPISNQSADVVCDGSSGTYAGEYLVTIDQNDLAGLSAGDYSGSLTINVAAE